ncbi:MAG TPA: WbqC family protein, partial [Vicinamibacterales bacterium]|nr:WbqC family protein [Vicinamibacterales bacterium]
EIRLASEMGIPGRHTEHLVGICKALGADGYYNGAAGESYIEPELFAAEGIALEFQRYRHPTYRQLHGAFVPYLSVIDLLFNAGPKSLSIIAAGHSGKALACAS